MRLHLLPLACVLAAIATPARAGTLYVRQNADGDVHDGRSWQTAFTGIADALAAAKAGDEIWVGPGVYGIPNRFTAPIVVPAGVGVYGGFLGTETRRVDAARRATLATLSNTEGVGLVLSFPAGAGPDTVVDGFTIEGAGDGVLRGAFSCVDASPTITHNLFRQNRSVVTRGDPGLYIMSKGGAPIIANNIFTEAPGDVIYCDGAGGRIVNNTIAGNGGTAVYITGGTAPLVANNILARNVRGIQVYNAPAPETRNNCVFGNPGGDYDRMPDPTGENGNISVDPGLMMPAYGNLHIRLDSPCVDAGDDGDVVGDRDVDFQPRIVGAHVDIGADEGIEPAWTFVPPVVRVSPEGDDAHDGSTWQNAKKTIQAAVDAAAADGGGEVWVAAGTYAAPDATGVLSDFGIQVPAYVYLYGGFEGSETERGQRDVTVNITTLTNGLNGNAVVTATSGHGVSAVDGFHFVVTKRNAPGVPGDVTGAGASPAVRHNVFGGGTRPFGQSSVVVSGGFPLVSDNVFMNAVDRATGVVVFGNAAPSVRRNVFRDNATAIGVIKGINCAVTDVEGNLFDGNSGSQDVIAVDYATRVIGNTFVNNKANAAGYGRVRPGDVFINNIVANNTFKVGGPIVADPVVRNNDFWNSGPSHGNDHTYGNIVADPMFVDAEGGDYRLSSASPCVDAGDDSVVAPGAVDLDGRARIQGRHVDMGAYESGAASPTHHIADAADALRIAGGLSAATSEQVAWLGAAPGDRITVTSAVRILRELLGAP